MDLILLDLFNNITYLSVHIRLGLACPIYVDAKSNLISDLAKCESTKAFSDPVKCELLTTFGKTDEWI